MVGYIFSNFVVDIAIVWQDVEERFSDLLLPAPALADATQPEIKEHTHSQIVEVLAGATVTIDV